MRGVRGVRTRDNDSLRWVLAPRLIKLTNQHTAADEVHEEVERFRISDLRELKSNADAE
jgi:hypothetical protein